MRIRAFLLAAPAVAASLVAGAPVMAATAVPYLLTVGVDVGGLTGQFSQAVLGDGSVRGSLSLAACDGSVKPVGECQSPADDIASITFEGSIFPYINGAVAFTDSGAPTDLVVSFGLFVPTIPGAAVSVIEGSVASSQSRSPGVLLSTLASGDFIEGRTTTDALVATVGDGALVQSDSAPTSEIYAPIVGAFDCAALGGCDLLMLMMGVAGLGDGETYTLIGRFDLDPAPTGVVPLPASVALLAGGLGALGLVSRRRRA